jgi:uncharacterized protein (DUF305 family)
MNIKRVLIIARKSVIANLRLRDVYISLGAFMLGIVVTTFIASPSMKGMHDSMKDMSRSIKGLGGKDLEKKFLEEMIVHHQGAIDMSKILLEKKTDNLRLMNTASKIIKVQEREIVDMTNWLKEYK